MSGKTIKVSPPIERTRLGKLIELSPDVKRQCVNLIRKECCNYQEGKCLILEGGYSLCAQIQNNHLCCRWFQNFVLPETEELEIAILGEREKGFKKCELCKKPFYPGSNRAKYCKECSQAVRRKKEAIRKKNRYYSPHLGAIKP